MSKEYISDLIKRLGEPVLPYGRLSQSQELLDGECDDYSPKTENHSTNGKPNLTYNITLEECADKLKLPSEKKFLWLIDFDEDKNLRLRLIPEQTENKNRKHKPIVCHSNFTQCGEALQGGECWWCDETETIYINPSSGRYGAVSVEQWDAVLEFFGFAGYKKVVDSNFITWNIQN